MAASQQNGSLPADAIDQSYGAIVGGPNPYGPLFPQQLPSAPAPSEGISYLRPQSQYSPPLTPQAQTPQVREQPYYSHAPIPVRSTGTDRGPVTPPATTDGSGTSAGPAPPPTAAGGVDGTPQLMTPRFAGEVDWADESLLFRQKTSDLLRAMQQERPDLFSSQIKVESAFRTEKQQQDAYNRYLQGKIALAGAPGTSHHEYDPRYGGATAADWVWNQTPLGQEARDWLYHNAPRFGLAFPYVNRGDPGHMQLASYQGETTQPISDFAMLKKAIYANESSSGTDPRTADNPWQIEPDTWNTYARQGESKSNPQDQEHVAQRIISDLYQKYGGSKDAVLIGYNAGEKYIGKPFDQLPPITQDYLKKAHAMWGESLDQDSLTKISGTVGAPYPPGLAPMVAAHDAAQRDEIETGKRLIALEQEALGKMMSGSPEYDAQLRKVMDMRIQDLERERQLTMHPPIEKPVDIWANFGSLATVVGVLGGMLSRRGLVASLDAAGAAMEAINTNNHEQYKQAFETWKDVATLTGQVVEHEGQVYKDILDDKKTNWAQKFDLLKLQFDTFGQIMGNKALETGRTMDAINIAEKLITMGSAMQEHAAAAAWHEAQKTKLDQENAQKAATEAQIAHQVDEVDMPQWLRDHPDATQADKDTARWNFNILRREQMATSGSKAAPKALTPKEQQQNAEIEAAKAQLFPLPPTWDAMTARQIRGEEPSDAELTGYSDMQRRLLRALGKQTQDLTQADKDVIKLYDNARKPLNTLGGVTETQPPAATPRAGPDPERYRRILANGAPRDQVKAAWVADGGKPEDFERSFPATATPGAPAASQNQPTPPPPLEWAPGAGPLWAPGF